MDYDDLGDYEEDQRRMQEVQKIVNFPTVAFTQAIGGFSLPTSLNDIIQQRPVSLQYD